MTHARPRHCRSPPSLCLLWWRKKAFPCGYTGRSSHGPDAVVTYIHIHDATNAMVEDATVTAIGTLPDGNDVTETAITNCTGIAEFPLWVGRGGEAGAPWLWLTPVRRESIMSVQGAQC